MFNKELYISCLASLIKFSCPWYLRRWIYQKIVRSFFLMLFLVGTVVFALLPFFEHNILYQAPLPQRTLGPEILEGLTHAEIVEEFKQHFPTPEDLTYHVKFWKTVFTRYTSRQIILHDNWYPQIIYEVVNLDHSPEIGPTIQKYKRILLSLHRKEQARTLDSLTPLEAKVYDRFAKISEPDKFKKAAYQRMRAQRGQRDSFIKAIRLSGLYQAKFEQIFRKYDVPIVLTRLPFIESYFNPKAYSSAGAAGLWQFMPATARLYGLRVNQKIDERYAPFKAADSAARLLKANYEIFQSWPLAVTAYNHGPTGLIEAVKQLGAKDLGKIVKVYQGPRFGFYSRNYYAQFLAAAQIMLDDEKYFGRIERLPALRYESVTIAQNIFINDIVSDLSIPKDDLIALNKDLKRAIIRSKSPLPKNFMLKLPPGKKAQFIKQYVNL